LIVIQFEFVWRPMSDELIMPSDTAMEMIPY
jgi:hypothetical protein